MAQYQVKPGQTAFLNGALRTEGYVHTREKPYPTCPQWAEQVAAEPRAAKPKAKPKASAEPAPSFTEPAGDSGTVVLG